VRDTPSQQAQIVAAFAAGQPAILPRPAIKDWIYAPDVADAVTVLIEAAQLRHRLYNVSSGMEWSALAWGEAFASLHPDLVCRLAAPGEAFNVDPHGPERAPLSVTRLAQEFGWRARFGCADSATALSRWWTQHREEN
jgi:UDP-glucose 4-epimerase